MRKREKETNKGEKEGIKRKMEIYEQYIYGVVFVSTHLCLFIISASIKWFYYEIFVFVFVTHF